MISREHSEYQILVVEDNAGDFTLVENFIYERIPEPVISRARTFKEAKEILSDTGHHYNIVLLDLSLPDHTGVKLIADMIELCGGIPVIVLTGYADFDFGVRSLSMSVSDYLLKDELTAMSLFKSIVYSTERKKIISALEASEKQVRSFANQLNNALEEERSRIAREIHDEFGQQLSGLKMSLSSLKKTEGIGGEMKSVIDLLVSDVNTSIVTVRQIANELRPALIDKLGLFAAIEWLAREFEKKTGTAVHLNIDVNEPEISKAAEINIFRICQEAFTNISKYSRATCVELVISNTIGEMRIKICDNGDGIRPGLLQDPLSMGLLNMKERAALINAALSIQSSPQVGTSIELLLSTNGKKDINS